MMGKSLDDVMAALPVDRQQRIRARGAELVADEMTLRELREAIGATQAQIASKLGKPQSTISRMEAQSDMLMSTLNQMIASMGGRISIVAELPGRAPIRLSGLGDLASVGLGDLAPSAKPSRKAAAFRGVSASRAKAARSGRVA